MPKFSAHVPNGTYTLTFQKPGYLAYIQSITVEGETELDETVLIPGDISGSTEDVYGDGVIDIDDIIRVLRGFSGGVSDDVRTVVDVNEDGIVDVTDLMLVMRGMRLSA